MNDFTSRPPKAQTANYNTLINTLREVLEVAPDIRRVNNILLELVDEVRTNPVKENLIVRELKDTVYDLQVNGDKSNEQVNLSIKSMQNFIKQLDPDYISEDSEGNPVIQVPMKSRQSDYSSLDREIELATAEGDDEEVAYLLRKKAELMKNMSKNTENDEINSEALEGSNNAKEDKHDINYNLNGLNLSEGAINALNDDLGVSVKNNKPEIETNKASIDWNDIKVEGDYKFPSEEETDKIVKEVLKDEQLEEIKEKPEEKSSNLDDERNKLLQRLAEIDRLKTPVEEVKVEKADEVNWENAFEKASTKEKDKLDTVETAYNDKTTDISNVNSSVAEVSEISNNKTVEDEEKSVRNIVHEVMPVEDFDKYMPAVSKVPSESMLTSFRGTRLEKIRAYQDAHKSGRKIYLPDSGYEVFISKMRDRQQLNYIFLLLEEAGYGSNLTQRYEIDELIRIVSEHVDFDFDILPDKQEFLYNVSPRDFSLLVLMFAIINSPDANDKNHAIAKIDRCGCKNCGNKVFLKEETALDLYESFVKTYPFDMFLSGYKDYINKKPTDIVLAYRKPGRYGELHKVTAEDDLFEYKLVFSKPTIGKLQNKDRNKDDVLYRLLVDNFVDKKESLDVPYMSNIDEVISLCPDFTTFKDYSRDFLQEYTEAIDKTEYKGIFNAVTYISEQLDKLEENNAGLLNLCTWVDMFKFTPKEDNKIEAEEFNHDDLYELFQAILTAPNEIISECVKVIDSMKDLEGMKGSAVDLDVDFIKTYISFDKTYFNDEEALKRFNEKNPNASEERRNKFINDRKVMRERMEKGLCPICESTEFSVEYPQLLFFSIASRLLPKQKI